jgi:outer membrane protein OmpA-like peptidoglycan-associated protein
MIENQGCPPVAPVPVVVEEPAPIVVLQPAPVVVAEAALPVKEAVVAVEKPVNLDSLFNREIFFKTAKAWLGPLSTKSLDQIVELMAKYPEVKVHLKGYTDYRSSTAYNQILSLKRVSGVKKYLVTQGVSPSRFKAEAFAEESPVSSTDLQLNRRVEVRIWR